MTNNKVLPGTGRPKPPAAGKGRVKGVPNKNTKALKDAIMNAFEKAGGEDYLVQLATTDPRTFAALLGKVLPLQVTGDASAPLQIKVTLGGDHG
jgi:hypothetical protein